MDMPWLTGSVNATGALGGTITGEVRGIDGLGNRSSGKGN